MTDICEAARHGYLLKHECNGAMCFNTAVAKATALIDGQPSIACNRTDEHRKCPRKGGVSKL